MNKHGPSEARDHAKSSSKSPNPSPRRSLEEKDQHVEHETRPRNNNIRTPVAKIRQFAGIDDKHYDNVSSAELDKTESFANGINGNEKGNEKT